LIVDLFLEDLMSTVISDKLLLIGKLIQSGVEQKQAESIVMVIVQTQDQLVTKQDFEIALAPIKADLSVNKWMMGVLLAGVVSLVLKAFFSLIF
jgi:hypothetical protein